MNTGSHYSVFTKDDFFYCVSIEYVREVIRIEKLILAPVSVAGFVGFLDFRKTLCPVLDIHSLLRNEQPEATTGPLHLIVLEFESSLFAVLIDRYVESIELAEDAQTPENSPVPEERKQLVGQVYRYKGNALNRLAPNFLKAFVQTHIKDQLAEAQSECEQETLPAENDPEIEMICFGIDHLRFGIPITDLVEVIQGYSVEPLFQTDPFLRGLINLRGQIIACVDISEAIGLPPRKMEEKNHHILLQHEEQDLALCIDSISEKQKFRRSQIQNVEHIFSGKLAEYLLGIIEGEPDRIFVMSGQKIFGSKHLLPYLE
jgi:chemotaxis signal transduction protein